MDGLNCVLNDFSLKYGAMLQCLCHFMWRNAVLCLCLRA